MSSRHTSLRRWLAARVSAGGPSLAVEGAASAAPAPPDLAEEALQRFRTAGQVHVTAPGGETEYALTAANDHRVITVTYRRRKLTAWGMWQPLNPGWGVHPALYTPSMNDGNHCPCADCTRARAKRDRIRRTRRPKPVDTRELAVLSILWSIFAGVQVWRLSCGHITSELHYSTTSTRKTGGIA